jgi:AAA domain
MNFIAQTGTELMSTTKESDVKSLIDGMVNRCSFGMIVAPPQSKKGFLALNLAFSLITQKPFLGFPVSQTPERIVYIGPRLSEHAFQTRVSVMNQHYCATNAQLKNISFLSVFDCIEKNFFFNTQTKMVNPSGFEKISSYCKDFGATVIIIDSLSFLTDGDEHDGVRASFLKELRKNVDRLNATLFLIRKQSNQTQDWSNPFMAANGMDSFDFVLGLEPKSRTTSLLHHGSAHHASLKPIEIRFDGSRFIWHRT